LQQAAYVAPVTEVEKVLCEIWQEVLGIEQVGLTDNFFELGGHSLLAVKLTSGIKKEFGVMISIRMMLEQPTINMLAKAIDSELTLKSLSEIRENTIIKNIGTL
jgi:acyl carrier protein